MYTLRRVTVTHINEKHPAHQQKVNRRANHAGVMFVGQYVGGLVVVNDDLSQEAKKASQCVDCSRHYTPVRPTLMLFR